MTVATQLRISAALIAVLVAGCGSSSHSSSGASGHSSSAAASSAYPSATTSSAASGSSVMITTKQSKLGTILAAGPKRLTVYLFEGDKTGASSCSGACAAAWPPVSGKPQATGAAASSDLATITRANGTTQVTYIGHALYYFVKDGDAGDAYGQGVKAFGAQWYVLAPSGNKVDTS